MRRIVGLAFIATLGLGLPARAQESALEAANKKVAIEFYQALLNDKDATRALALTAEDMVDLYPGPRPGRETASNVANMMKARRPNARTEIVRAFAEGPYVILYALNSDGSGGPPREVVEFFKVENGKLTEHWDVLAPPPAAPVGPSPDSSPPR